MTAATRREDQSRTIGADEEHLVVRWKAQGTYQGGFPGAPSEAVGREVTFTGTDTLRIADGKLAEYWANADSLPFFQQLGVRELPARPAT
jgi:predicted ester cyclase